MVAIYFSASITYCSIQKYKTLCKLMFCAKKYWHDLNKIDVEKYGVKIKLRRVKETKNSAPSIIIKKESLEKDYYQFH